MDIDVQDAVCAFVRDIISARTNETIEIIARPDRDERNLQAVEEPWESPTRRYAIEHTRVEAFEGQIANQAWIIRLLVPVKAALADRLPGYFGLAVREANMSGARIDVKAAQLEVARLVLEAAGSVPIGEIVTLKSDELPFTLQLYLRHKDSRNLILYTDIEGDPEARRFERIRRALDAKCPKLKKWTADNGRTSVLALESNDIQLSNAFVISDAVQHALQERDDQPDVVVLVETDIAPMNGWMLKEGDRYGDDVPVLNGGYCYTEGQIRH
jgi:hypothetical protein